MRELTRIDPGQRPPESEGYLKSRMWDGYTWDLWVDTCPLRSSRKGLPSRGSGAGVWGFGGLGLGVLWGLRAGDLGFGGLGFGSAIRQEGFRVGV